MVDMALTADAEIRRLKQLAEATHDWCEIRPRPAASSHLCSTLGSATGTHGLLDVVRRHLRALLVSVGQHQLAPTNVSGAPR
jgi:hypothetical protein